MVKQRFRQGIVLFLSLTVAVFGLCFPVCAVSNGEKISLALSNKLDQLCEDETVGVSVWLRDINYEAVEQEVTTQLEKKVSCGELSKNVLALPQDDLKTMQSTTFKTETVLRIRNEIPQEVKNAGVKDTQEFIEIKRAVSRSAYELQNQQLFNDLFPKEKQDLLRTVTQEQPEILYSCKYAPNILMKLTKEQVYSAAQSENVESLDYFDENAAFEPNAETEQDTAGAASIDTTYFDRTGVTSLKSMGYTGKNVKIGMLDSGVPDVNSPVFSDAVADNRIHIRQQDTTIGSHASYMASLLVGKTATYTGAAPDAALYCVDGSPWPSLTYQALEWLIEQGVNIINLSWNYPVIGIDNYYSDVSKWFDHLIYAHNVTVVNSAGNGDTSSGAIVNENRIGENPMAYNVISVGNYDSAYEQTGSTTAYNTIVSLPFKPDLVAPGYRVHTPLDKEGEGATGTSCSAPIVAGAAAQLCQMYSYFKTKPLILKAALLAGAVKTREMKNEDEDSLSSNDIDSVSGNWRIALSRKSGAGMLNVQNAYNILRHGQYAYFPNFGGTNNPFLQEIDVTSTSKRLQICLCWPKKNTASDPNHSTGAIDGIAKDTFILELLDPQGELIYNSWYRNDTKEYIAFTPGTAGTYTIRVRKTAGLDSGTDFALSWSQY